jgi:hypothetical protein
MNNEKFRRALVTSAIFSVLISSGAVLADVFRLVEFSVIRRPGGYIAIYVSLFLGVIGMLLSLYSGLPARLKLLRFLCLILSLAAMGLPYCTSLNEVLPLLGISVVGGVFGLLVTVPSRLRSDRKW